MAKRKAQINFQVDDGLKLLYEEAKHLGLSPTRLCAAGLLLLIEQPRLRVEATSRLRAWEQEYADASPSRVRRFVEELEAAFAAAVQESQPARPARRPARGPARAGSGRS